MCTTLTTMAVKLKKMASKLLTEEVRYVGRCSRDHGSLVRQGTQGMLTREHVSPQATLTREYISK